ncbi:glycosyltransferase [Pseudonocardiaceae bacterium YIM PH 21723]|nr:glycosyltransferase [Pseudonocardiaceae bacterium YIM PH 21723]
MSKHIAFVCMPSVGHLTPVLAVARELVDRGHRVTIPTIKRLQSLVEASGAAAPLFHSPLHEVDQQTSLRKDARPEDFAPHWFVRRLFQEAQDVAPQIQSILDGDRPDLLAYDQMTWYGFLLAERRGVPHVRTCPSVAGNEHVPARGDAVIQDAEPEILAGLDAAWNEARAFLGLPPMPILDAAVHQPDLGIVFCTQSFQPHGETFDERHRFVGPCLGDRPNPQGWQRPDGDLPIIYVSLGTVFNDQPAFYRTVIEAFRDEPWNLELVIGPRVRPAELGDIPPNVRLHEFAPQLEILPHAAVFLSHCGMGGVQEALSFGVPMIGVPNTPEQRANADRIAELGLGLRLPEVTAPALRAAVAEVLADTGIRDRLAAMRDDITAAGGTRRAAGLLEGFPG